MKKGGKIGNSKKYIARRNKISKFPSKEIRIEKIRVQERSCETEPNEDKEKEKKRKREEKVEKKKEPKRGRKRRERTTET